MPNMDGTGPRGTGRFGRGMGPCGKHESNLSNAPFGGQHRGKGMGFRCLGLRRRAVEMQNTNTNTSAIYEYERENLIAEQQKLEKQLSWIQNILKETKES